MKKGILIVVFALFVSVVPSFAQAFFPTEKNAFYDKLSSYLNSSTAKQDREDAAAIMQSFKGVWDSYYDNQEANIIMGLCERLHAKSGGKAYANIFNFIEIAQKLPEMASYVQDHPEINNILISGGDAFMNTNSLLRRYLETFSSLPNIQYIRFGTRIPVVLPARITEDQELQDLLNEYSRIRQIIVVTQFNHPRELTEEAGEAVRLLRKCGCIVRNQTVLLKGVNDEPSVLAALFNGLVGIGVLPYYVFQCRPVRGVKNQFQVPIRDGVKTVDAAKSRMSGQAKGFRYAMSHPKGKIEILAEMPDGSVLFKFHQAKYEKDASRLFTLPLSETQAWLPVNI